MLDGQCPRCKRTEADGLVCLHHWKIGHRSRRVTKDEIEAFADGSATLDEFELEHGHVSESGVYVSGRCWIVLWACKHCRRAWWTKQRSLVERACELAGIRVPDPPRQLPEAA